ncbi:acetylornithine deacetylase [Acetomicrobium thermoterrenum DSM 13490]|uniref:Acetylornithine deacetylase n=1 Tax=Acetomicrobium thermoterrenum DSM 13490 TaxID=1120987 RepID=A0A1H3EN55_9BACT|nr:M20/M25/M40 family metallo-hydrolase [Acetomicrobium thermoterrenum]SDX80172.1 acetylornithine deacetylase [Acetomicrobium thermoterrenum DSM 13490]
MSAERNLLFDLVSIASASYKEAEACDYLNARLPSLGWDRSYIDYVGNVVATKGEGDNEIILLGHIDTVEGGPKPKVEDDTLWGRGAVDAKGPLCAMALAGGKVKLARNCKLTLIAAIGEESDSRGILYRLPLHKPKACIVGEPSNTRGITIGYRGCIRAILKAKDGGGHRSADAGPLTSVTLAASEILNRLRSNDQSGKSIAYSPSGAIVSMRGQERGRRTAKMELDIRVPIGGTLEEYRLLVEKICKKYKVEHDIALAIPSHVTDKNNIVAKAFRTALRRQKLEPRVVVKSGTADFNHAAAWDCPMVAYGPGDSTLDHTMTEHIVLSEYFKSIDVLETAIALISSYVSSGVGFL